jgi:hypothetical protein
MFVFLFHSLPPSLLPSFFTHVSYYSADRQRDR